jgi:hypothetical protein
MIQAILNKLRERLNKWHFQHALSRIRSAPPIKLGDEPFTLLSMVHHRDVDAYLLAVKSFVRYLHPRKIVVVTDPSITEVDKSFLKSQVCGIQLIPAEINRHENIPVGGCWERLCAIACTVTNDYVIQLDADTVTLGYPAEVAEAIRNESSFVLATEDGQGFVSCQEIAAWARGRLTSGDHIQVLAESKLDCLANYSDLRYTRGCAGFSGFARNSFGLSRLCEFSKQMQGLFGTRWAEWGTEQFTSNFMVANSPAATVLPHPKYCHPLRERPGTVFLHFVGFVRFKTGRYAEVTKSVCNHLSSKKLAS